MRAGTRYFLIAIIAAAVAGALALGGAFVTGYFTAPGQVDSVAQAPDLAPAATAPPAAPAPSTTAAKKGPPPRQFQDWVVICPEPGADGKAICQAAQKVTIKESGKQLMQVVVGFPAGDDKAIAVFFLPLGMLLPQGAKLVIGDVEIGRLAVQRCEPGGCIAPLQLTDEVLSKLNSSPAGKIVVTNAEGKNIDIPLSLKGFSAAFADLKKG